MNEEGKNDVAMAGRGHGERGALGWGGLVLGLVYKGCMLLTRLTWFAGPLSDPTWSSVMVYVE